MHHLGTLYFGYRRQVGYIRMCDKVNGDNIKSRRILYSTPLLCEFLFLLILDKTRWLQYNTLLLMLIWSSKDYCCICIMHKWKVLIRVNIFLHTEIACMHSEKILILTSLCMWCTEKNCKHKAVTLKNMWTYVHLYFILVQSILV